MYLIGLPARIAVHNKIKAYLVRASDVVMLSKKYLHVMMDIKIIQNYLINLIKEKKKSSKTSSKKNLAIDFLVNLIN